jgi:hypothetical protein
MYLLHSAVESPDMKNVYDGVAVLDDDGGTEVQLPRWFEALNRDYRYQLTPIGASAPNLHISREVANGSFSIAGGIPNMRVCWQVTGIRKDAWAEAYPIPVEEMKVANDRGRYLHPQVFGQPSEARIGLTRQREIGDDIEEVLALGREVLQQASELPDPRAADEIFPVGQGDSTYGP